MYAKLEDLNSISHNMHNITKDLFAMKRTYHGDWMDALPSRFINEIPDESVEKNEISSNDMDDFDFNQDSSIEFEDGYRSPGWNRYKKNKILKWKK